MSSIIMLSSHLYFAGCTAIPKLYVSEGHWHSSLPFIHFMPLSNALTGSCFTPLSNAWLEAVFTSLSNALAGISSPTLNSHSLNRELRLGFFKQWRQVRLIQRYVTYGLALKHISYRQSCCDVMSGILLFVVIVSGWFWWVLSKEACLPVGK